MLNELRIGNWIESNKGYIQVEPNTFNSIKAVPRSYKPIDIKMEFLNLRKDRQISKGTYMELLKRFYLFIGNDGKGCYKSDCLRRTTNPKEWTEQRLFAREK